MRVENLEQRIGRSWIWSLGQLAVEVVWLFLFKDLLVCLTCRVRACTSICWLIPRESADPELGHAASRSPEPHPDLPCVCQGPGTWAIVSCLPGSTSRSLDWKQSCQNSIWHSGIQSLSVPHCQPVLFLFGEKKMFFVYLLKRQGEEE